MGLFGKFKAPKATISVTLDKHDLSINEPMTGKMGVSSSEEFDADELRIEMWVTEDTTASDHITVQGRRERVTARQSNILHNGKIPVAGRTQITEGYNEEFPFSISLPTTIPPSYRGQNASNTWRLKGVIAVKGRPDVVGHEMEIQVKA